MEESKENVVVSSLLMQEQDLLDLYTLALAGGAVVFGDTPKSLILGSLFAIGFDALRAKEVIGTFRPTIDKILEDRQRA